LAPRKQRRHAAGLGLDFDNEPGHARLALHYSADGAVSSIDAFDASNTTREAI
jgi:hypothetical protein